MDNFYNAALPQYPVTETIVSFFERLVIKTPHAVALVFEDHQLTYQALNEQANQLAHYLIEQGVGPERLVALCLERSEWIIVAMLAILKAGGAYVPIDPANPDERIADILADVAPSALIADEASTPALRHRLEKTGLWPTLIDVGRDRHIIAQRPRTNPATELIPTNQAYVIHTSGSTGKPKGVMIQHNNLLDYLYGLQQRIQLADCRSFALVSTPAADLGYTVLYGSIMAGGTLHVLPTETAMNPVRMHDYFNTHRIDCLKIVPAHWQALCVGEQLLLPAKKLIFGGETLSAGLIERIRASGATCQIINHYGPTETTIGKLLHVVQPQNNYTHAVPLGRPFSNTTVYVCSEQLDLCPAGVPGELLIGGAGVARGYLNQPALTDEKFIPNPFGADAGDKLYKTGDLVRWSAGGELEFLGRIDDQVKINGYRIELGEIEGALRQYPSVEQCVVMANEGSAGNKQLIAYVVASQPLETTAVTAHLSRRLPAYMVPDRVVPLDALPLTSNGKIDRKALPNVPAQRTEPNVVYKAPETPTEQRLADLWQSLLGIDKVGTNDNFFAIGGNSLLAMKTVAVLKERYDYHLPITKLYDYKVIQTISQFLDNPNQDSQPAAIRNPQRNGDPAIHEVAVIGMAGRFPGADTIDELWDVLKAGRETIRFFADEELDAGIDPALKSDPNYVKARGVINRAAEFDAAFFGINPRMAELMDPQQRVFLEIAWEALEQAGYVPQRYGGTIGVFSGCRFNSYYQNNVLAHPELIEKQGPLQVLYHNDKDYISSRTAYALNLKGPAVTVQSACSTSLLAIAQAVESIRRSQCEMALAGGALITAPVNSGHLYQEGAMFSPDGHCRPFDAGAKGTVFSDGAGVVLLKSRQRAEADGDTIYAIVKGVGVNNDGGEKASFTAPSSDGQAGAIRMAIADAGVEPATISYVEAHGTATPLGDPIEIEGLTKAFGPQRTTQFCALGSIKSNLGHLVTAAGVAGFIKTVLSLYHRQIPPSLFYEQPNPAIDFASSPFYVNATLNDWQSDTVRRAGVSSFGVGGTNVHVVLEESENSAPAPEADQNRPFQLISWSAKTAASREAYAQRLAAHLRQTSPASLADLAFTLHTTRADFNHRRFVVAGTGEQLVEKLGTVVSASEAKTLRDAPGEVVFLFPGQGAQYLNMGRELYEHEPVFRRAVDTCAELLQSHLGTDIRLIIYPEIANGAAEERLKNTAYTQPALFVVEYALAQLWMHWGIEPTILCGHSIGEFVAAHLAGVVTLADALKLVAIRGRLVSQRPRGSMLSVKCAADQLRAGLSADLSLAAINSTTLCVVAGPDEAIAGFARALDQQEIPNRVLTTSHAFHSAMMDPVVPEFTRVVGEVALSRPRKRIVSTVSGTWLTDAQATDPQYWATHLRLTVCFAGALETLFEQKAPTLLEVGPGDVTTALARQQAGPRPATLVTSLNTGKGGQTDYQSVLKALGQLWLNGLEPDWQKFYAGQRRVKQSLPTYAFDKKRYWVDPMPAPMPAGPAQRLPVRPAEPDQALPTDSPHPDTMRKTRILHTVKNLLEDASGIELTDVTPDVSFLEIGLDSLSLTQVALTLRKELGVSITFRQLNEAYATLGALVDYLDEVLPAEILSPEVIAQPTVSLVAPPVVTGPAYAQNGTGPVQGQPALALMAQQLQMLSQQVAVMQQGGAFSGVATARPAESGLSKLSLVKPAELTPDEAAEIKKPFGAAARIERLSTELTRQQQDFLAQLTQRYNQKTAGSKAYTQQHRAYMADPRVVSGFKPKIKDIVYPIVINRSKGSRLWDIDGNEYIDILNGFGSNLLGYQPAVITDALAKQVASGYEIGPQHELAGEVCRLICEFTGSDRAALCSTGSEAVLGAMRIARTVTNRSLIVAFTGSYHGIVDEVIVRGSKRGKSYPAAPGIMPEAVQNMLILDYGTEESLRIIRERADELAGVLVEPVQSRRPEFVPIDFLKEVRAITAASGTALIFDEVITGFRMHPGGVQGLFGIKADLASYGKVVGAGLPIGVIAGQRKFLDALDGGFWQYGDDSFPEAGVTYFAGTFVRHPLALATAQASLQYMKDRGPALQQSLNAKGERVASALNAEFERLRLPMYVAQFGSLWKIKYKEEIPYSELLFTLMREKGIHVWDGFPCFMTEAHTDKELDRVIELFIESTHQMMAAGFFKASTPEAGAGSPESDPNVAPVPGAKIGRDPDGNPAWFMPNPEQSGRFLRVEAGDVIRSESYFTIVDYHPFAGSEVSRTAPTTESQLEIWTACRLGGDNANRAYNESNSLHLRGVPDRAALERAVQALLSRHDALRSVFSGDGRRICVLARATTALTYHDFSDETATDAEERVRSYVRQEATHVFDLANGPLFKPSLLKLSGDEHYLVLTAHHIICDGWSMGVILQDLGRLYSAYARNVFVELAPAPSFSQYAVEQARFARSEAYESVEQFWLAQYQGDVPVLDLPTDAPRPALRTYQGARRDYPLNPELVQTIKKLGVSAGCSFVTTLMAAFEVFLYRLTGQENLVLGLPVAGQSFTGNPRLVGHCVNLLPLRSDPKADQRFSDYLKQRKKQVFDAYEFPQLTFGSLLKQLNLVRDASRIPLVPVVFNIDMGKADGVSFAGLTSTVISNPRAYENFELFVNANGSESALTLEWSYNTHLFKAGTIDRMMNEFEQLLRTVVAEPAVRIGALPVRYDSEQLAKLARWNQTEADYPSEVALTQLIAQTAALYPAKTALTFNGRSLSYRALNEQANQIAQGLVQRGIRVGDLIGVALDRSPEMLITLLAVMKAGAAYVPLDPTYPADRIRFMLTDSAARLLITSAEHGPRLRGETAPLLIEDVLAASDQYPKTRPDVPVSGDNLAYVLYTSGSTGKPKGVLITHRNLVNLLWSMYSVPGIRPDDVLLAVTTISFDIAGLELYLPLIAGATVALADAETTRDGRALVQIIEEQPITLMQATPATYKLMLAAGWKPSGESALNILCCGEPMSKDLAHKLIPRCRTLWNMYGPTETTIYSTGKQILATDEVITIGRPINNTQAYILDASLRPVAEGGEGEIYLAGDGVAQGYLNRPELTTQKFVDNPFAANGGGRMYRTGDLGRFLENGEIQCLGRIDHQVKLRGHRIELGEIENTLRALEDIKDAVVVAHEDQPGDQRLVAYVVPESPAVNNKVPSWQERWNVIYDTGLSITEQVDAQKDVQPEIDEWVQQSLRRIRALQPKRIMEVGCGDGQLLFALAPDAARYIGTDYAQAAIDTLRQKIALQPESWRHVSVATAPADDFSLAEASSLDLVLIHSVAQYFPNADYLLRVLEQAARVTANGGCIFVGDVQGKNTLRMHHAFDQFRRSNPSQTLREFKQTVDRRVWLEDELTADPAFFYRLPQLIPAIKAVDVQLREGERLNETTKYHYDVWLYVGESPQIVNVEQTINWHADYSLGALEQALRANPHQVIEVRAIANERTAPDYAFFRTMEGLPDHSALAEVKQKLPPTGVTVAPDALRAVGQRLNFRAYVRWSSDGFDNGIDVVFIPTQYESAIPPQPQALRLNNASVASLIRNPSKPDQLISPEQIQRWKQRARLTLPDYMVPADFVVLPRMPLTPNGKIDRRALPAPDSEPSVRQEEYVSPRTDLEKRVAAVWTDHLKLAKISVTDNFFELGGHSLIAVQIMVRLEKETGKRLPLSALLEHPTIEKLARLLERDDRSARLDSLVPIRPQGTKTPLYIVHGAGLNVLLFNALAMHLDPEQPVFGLQPAALNGIDEPPGSVEEIAASYIKAILEQNPAGPYALAGYSLGGTIAYEMVRQFGAMGKKVDMLALFDTYAYQSNQFKPWPDRVLTESQLVINKVAYTVRSFAEAPRQTIRYKRETLKHRMASLRWKLGNYDKHYQANSGHFPVLEQAYQTAARGYQLIPQAIRIDLFRAKKRAFYRNDFEYLGWKPFALNGVSIHEIPGDHFTIFTLPDVKEFAQTLQAVLNSKRR